MHTRIPSKVYSTPCISEIGYFFHRGARKVAYLQIFFIFIKFWTVVKLFLMNFFFWINTHNLSMPSKLHTFENHLQKKAIKQKVFCKMKLQMEIYTCGKISLSLSWLELISPIPSTFSGYRHGKGSETNHRFEKQYREIKTRNIRVD